MCNPALIIPAIGAVVGVAGGVTSANAAKRQANQDAKASAAQAEHAKIISMYNANQIRRQAEQVRRIGTEEENKVRLDTANLISAQKAATAAGGIEVNTGTPAALQVSSARWGEVDALRVRDNYKYQSESLEEQAVITELEGDMSRTAGLNAAEAYRKGGRNARLGGLLTTAGNAISSVDPSWFD